MTSIKKKEEKIKIADVTFFLDAFCSTAWAFFNKILFNLLNVAAG
jgi:hypothetical protein